MYITKSTNQSYTHNIQKEKGKFDKEINNKK